jgi:hypothetical protein
MTVKFKPVLFLKKGCPFCFKLRLALLEADMLGEVNIDEFAEGSPQEVTIRNELSNHFEDVSFPSAEVERGKFMNDSDALIRRFLSDERIDPKSLPTLQAYIHGPFSELLRLFKENKALKKLN